MRALLGFTYEELAQRLDLPPGFDIESASVDPVMRRVLVTAKLPVEAFYEVRRAQGVVGGIEAPIETQDGIEPPYVRLDWQKGTS
jgi:hypothetical protein